MCASNKIAATIVKQKLYAWLTIVDNIMHNTSYFRDRDCPVQSCNILCR